MQILKRLLTATGALALLAILLTVAAPKQAHAVVTTWVTVVNAIGNPVVTQDTPHMASQLVTLVAPVSQNSQGQTTSVRLRPGWLSASEGRVDS